MILYHIFKIMQIYFMEINSVPAGENMLDLRPYPVKRKSGAKGIGAWTGKGDLERDEAPLEAVGSSVSDGIFYEYGGGAD